MCPSTSSNEKDPLLAKSSGATKQQLPRKTEAALRKRKRKQQKRNCLIVSISVVALAFVLVGMVVIKKATSPMSLSGPSSFLGRARDNRKKVSYDAEKEAYVVDWNRSNNNNPNGNGDGDAAVITSSTTFAELAEIILLPWYEASIVAVLDDPAWKDGISPDNIAHIRKVLLIARDMLDIFSPVFPDKPDGVQRRRLIQANKKRKKKNADGTIMKDKSLWKELRKVYRHGYQVAGELHDLLGLTYSDELLRERVGAVESWKSSFVAFQKTHRIRRYLYSDFQKGGGIDPHGCYFHQASHLFWSETAKDSLPCGDDPGPTSLRKLGSVQLQHCLEYLTTISGYTTVLPRTHEINFHNLRKELRIFTDEYNLFGNVLVPDDPASENENSEETTDETAEETSDAIPDGNSTMVTMPPASASTTLQEKLELLDTTQKKLGKINDKWTALSIYVEDNSHKKEQEKLKVETDEKWMKFLDWQSKHDLKGTMEAVLNRMNE